MEFFNHGSNRDCDNPKGFQDVYESLEKDQPCDVVMKLYEKMKGIVNTTSDFDSKTKCRLKSENLRMQGNQALKSQLFGKTLKLYNAALLFAPKSSWSLKVAYSNRSALLLQMRHYEAALKDIDMCFELGCPDSLVEKLTTRKNKCLEHLEIDNRIMECVLGLTSSSFLQLDAKRNSQIPCASKAVAVNMNGPTPTVIAAEEIKPGTLVALETAFVGISYIKMDTCYYCLKVSLNLIPCDNCCIALFCDRDCKERCLKEYHEIECNLLNEKAFSHGLALKAVIKIKNECSSWCEFIQAFENYCWTINKNSSIEEMFNNDNKFSLIHTMYSRPKDYGKIFTTARVAAMLIHKLANKSFFPINKERQLAMRATAGMFMHLAMYIPHSSLLQASFNGLNNYTSVIHYHAGLFSFIGKLKHSCDANLLVVPLKNQAGLIALRTIPPGTELTISYINHHFLRKHSNRSIEVFKELGCICSCKMCAENWNPNNPQKNYQLTESQKKYLKETNLSGFTPDKLLSRLVRSFLNIDSSLKNDYLAYYHNLWRGLDLLKNLQCTDVYNKIFLALMGCLFDIQYKETRNITMN